MAPPAFADSPRSSLVPGSFPFLPAHSAGDHVAIIAGVIRTAQRPGSGSRLLVPGLQDILLALDEVPVEQLQFR
jgi:hypothetical protein